MPPQDHFAALGLPGDASVEAVKKAYFTLAKTHHPDKGGDARTFEAITEAFNCLSDETRRKDYLAWLARVERNAELDVQERAAEAKFERARSQRLTAMRKRNWFQRLFSRDGK